MNELIEAILERNLDHFSDRHTYRSSHRPHPTLTRWRVGRTLHELRFPHLQIRFFTQIEEHRKGRIISGSINIRFFCELGSYFEFSYVIYCYTLCVQLCVCSSSITSTSKSRHSKSVANSKIRKNTLSSVYTYIRRLILHFWDSLLIAG